SGDNPYTKCGSSVAQASCGGTACVVTRGCNFARDGRYVLQGDCSCRRYTSWHGNVTPGAGSKAAPNSIDTCNRTDRIDLFTILARLYPFEKSNLRAIGNKGLSRA